MRSWGHFSGLLGPKFWEAMRKDGVMRAVLRGKPNRSQPHEIGGWDELVPCVGVDEYGNRYYEDLTHHNFNTRRWVEYSSVFEPFPTGERTMPPWNGWLHYTYDDPYKPQYFVQPFYREAKPFAFETDDPRSFLNPGYLLNPTRAKFNEAMRKRKYSEWVPCEDPEDPTYVKERKGCKDYTDVDETLMNIL